MMQTGYGELRVIDAHVHFFSHQFFQSFLRSRGRQFPEQDPRSLLQRLGVPVLFHFGLLQSAIGAALKLPSQADARYSNPMDLQRVARDFPGVNFIVPHFGAGYFGETLLLAAHCPNVFIDTSSANGWVRYMPYPMDLKLVFQRTLEAMGPERIIFGTDSSHFPRGFRQEILETQVAILKALGVSKEDAQLMMGGNIARLLRLDW